MESTDLGLNPEDSSTGRVVWGRPLNHAEPQMPVYKMRRLIFSCQACQVVWRLREIPIPRALGVPGKSGYSGSTSALVHQELVLIVNQSILHPFPRKWASELVGPRCTCSQLLNDRNCWGWVMSPVSEDMCSGSSWGWVPCAGNHLEAGLPPATSLHFYQSFPLHCFLNGSLGQNPQPFCTLVRLILSFTILGH